MASLADLREEYAQHTLDLADVAADPIIQFEQWMQEALKAEIPEPNAMTLSTANALGQPFARVVLLKGLSNGKFVFYTNYQSRKGQQIDENPKVALSFLWLPLERQVTIVGSIAKVAPSTSDKYFASRPRGSQLGAWTSPQSEAVPDRKFLENREKEVKKRFEGESVTRPPHWGGYAVSPTSIEFWQGRTSRLHDRILYDKTHGGGWKLQRLAP